MAVSFRSVRMGCHPRRAAKTLGSQDVGDFRSCACLLPLLTGVDRKRYHDIKDEWFGNTEVFERQDIVEVIPASFDLVFRVAELFFYRNATA